MKRFLVNTIRFSLIGVIPILILFILYLLLDPFKVIKPYDSYFDSKAKGRFGINKDYASTTTFINNSKKIKYNSFIFGNSRSILYQVSDWKKHLPENAACFHFDASAEALWALNKKIEFLDNKGVNIENVLLILDYDVLIQDAPKSGHLFIISPALVNNSDIIEFHKAFFYAFLSPKFLFAFLDFQFSNVVKPYMKKGKLLEDTPRNYDVLTNEYTFEYFENLINANKYYTAERLSVFFDRDTVQRFSPQSILKNQITILTNMKSIFNKHNTKVKVVISPLYDQIKLNDTDLMYLKSLFGIDNVFDFSGINKFTNNYKNYFEASHYRSHVAREIMEIIYANKLDTNDLKRIGKAQGFDKKLSEESLNR